jgi:hypothetical protein
MTARDGALTGLTSLEGPSRFHQQPQAVSGAGLPAGDREDHSTAVVVGEKRARFPSARQQLLQDTQVELAKLANRKPAAVRPQKRAFPAIGHDLSPVHDKKPKKVGQRAAYRSTDYQLGELEDC